MLNNAHVVWTLITLFSSLLPSFSFITQLHLSYLNHWKKTRERKHLAALHCLLNSTPISLRTYFLFGVYDLWCTMYAVWLVWFENILFIFHCVGKYWEYFFCECMACICSHRLYKLLELSQPNSKQLFFRLHSFQ